MRVNYYPTYSEMKSKRIYDLYCRVRFKMFPELRDEFGDEYMPADPKEEWHEKFILVEPHKNDSIGDKIDTYTYGTQFDYPYGEIQIDFMFVGAGKKFGDSDFEPKLAKEFDKEFEKLHNIL